MARDPRKKNATESKLDQYRQKRDFARTAEPAGGTAAASETGKLYVIQKHRARRLHYDFRLELDGVLLSWAVPKGPSLDPQEKPLAVQTEDHPIEYGSFEGIIPKGEYGAGTVMVWDRGEWEPIGDPREGYKKGDLKFQLHGEKLRGAWALVRMGGKAAEDGKNWLLIKKKDDESRSIHSYNVLGEMSRSVLSGRSLDEIAVHPAAVWKDGAAQAIEPDRAETKKARPQRVAAARTAPGLDPSTLPHACVASLPEFIQPQLAISAAEAPEGDQWLHEVKLDGYRLLARIDSGEVRLLTRNRNDWTDRFPSVARALTNFPFGDAILDGEVVVLNQDGVPDFGSLQNALSARGGATFRYFVFDIPYMGGYDLTRTPLLARKGFLRAILGAWPGLPETVQFSDHIVGSGPLVLQKSRESNVEGIISKRTDSIYESRRSATWLKVKNLQRQEFVVGGFTDPSGSRSGFGALLLGYYNDEGELTYCGRVGTGFSDSLLDSLASELKSRERRKAPFLNPEADPEYRRVHWVEPETVVEVEFTGWTRDDLLRHPAYRGRRDDIDPRTVRREQVQAGDDGDPPAQKKTKKGRKVVRSPNAPEDAFVRGVRISNPTRTVYPDDGVTKRDVAEYFAAVSKWILPHVTGRPLALVRCPLGLAGESFFQREVGQGFPHPIRGITVGDDKAIVIDDLDGLLSLVQMGTLEIHAWGCREDKPTHPDRLVFDLDPGPGILWEHVVESARFIRGYLSDLGLTTFVKTTGGKGLHLVAPIIRRADWEEVKNFAKGVAYDLVRIAPLNFVATTRKDLRENRIYVDYLRNQEGATAVAAYSTRARNGACISTPLSWDELSAERTPEQFNLRTVPPRMAALEGDPWAGFDDVRQSITKKMMQAFQ